MPTSKTESPRIVPDGGRICIVGGGTTGLLAAKSCIDEGLSPTVFEKTSRVGGVWRLDEYPDRVAYKSLYTNSSGSMMCISDYPLDAKLHGCFPYRQDICDYYESYISHFELDDFVVFGTTVISVHREDSQWIVHTSDASGTRETHLFDAVFLCTGQFKEPKFPPLPSAEAFCGTISHSSSYRDASNLQGRSLVLVGLGNSALDISLEAVRAGCASVTILCRSGTNIIPVADYYGRPADQMLNTRFYSNLPSLLKQLFFFQIIRGTNAEFQRYGMPAPPHEQKHMGFSNLKEHVAYRQFLREGRIKFINGTIEDFHEHSIVVSTGEEIAVDDIIFCTGYKLEFPFLREDLSENFVINTVGRQHLNAYKLVMHPSHPTLCALGFLLTFGNESCVAEMQARWAISHWIGRTPLPSMETMEKDLDRRRKGNKYPQFVPYVDYMDALALECGVAPPLSWRTLLQSPSLFWSLFMSPVVPAQYRLAGDHAWPQAADFIRKQPSTAQRWFELFWAPPHSSSAVAQTAVSRHPASRL